MSEPLTDRLSRFTPDPSGLDRDGLLFAAGRASVRPNRAWQALAGFLAASQLVTLGLLWPGSGPPAVAPGQPPPIVWKEERSVEVASGNAAALWSMKQRLLETKGDDLPPPAAVEELVSPGPPLHAFAAPPASLLD